MANIIRRSQEPRGLAGRQDPLRSFRDFRDSIMRDFFDDWGSMLNVSPFREFEPFSSARMFSPDIEVKETKDHYVFCADVPGLKDEDVQVSITGNRLTISGAREQESRDEGDQYYVVERNFGSFTRSFMLPEGADLDSAKADLKDGVLRVEIPKKTAASSRQIPIGSTSVREMEGGARPEQAAAGQESGEATRIEERKPAKAA